MSVTLEQAVDREKTAEELLGELAHQLSLLVRSELEVAAAERAKSDSSAPESATPRSCSRS